MYVLDYNYCSRIVETQLTDTYSKPTEVSNAHFVFVNRCFGCPSIGKWMVFRHFDEIDKTWKEIRTAVLDNTLSGCVVASCSTMLYNPTACGPGPRTTGVICIFTDEHNVDDVGFRLIKIVKQDIKYKLDKDSREYKYVHVGAGRVSIKTIYWNYGRPSFMSNGRPCYGSFYRPEDIWHLNVVKAREPLASQRVHGRWVLFMGYFELTGFWHFMKGLIESEADNFGVIKMMCPPKHAYSSPTEVPVFHVYTSDKNRKTVGSKLIRLIKRDICYEHKPHGLDTSRHVDTLFWNNGEPSEKMMECEGITKTWKTAKELL